jgi:hypothetical protein
VGSRLYHVKAEPVEFIAALLEVRHIDIREAQGFFMHCRIGFDPLKAFQRNDEMFSLTVMFRGLRKEYVYMLPVIFTQNWYGCQWA